MRSGNFDTLVRYPHQCSDKDCCCGGHSHKDVKKNRHHHSTKMREAYKILRSIKNKIRDAALTQMAMAISEKSLQECWGNEDDAHWESFL